MGSKLQVTPTKLQVTPTKLQVTLTKLQVTPTKLQVTSLKLFYFTIFFHFNYFLLLVLNKEALKPNGSIIL